MAEYDTTDSELSDAPEFSSHERRSAGDFPFYRGSPVALSGAQWAVVLIGTAFGFAALTAPLEFYRTTAGGFLAVILFFAIPLAALGLVAGSGWTALFRKLVLRDVLWMIGVAVANLAVSVVIVLLVRNLFDMSANPVGGMLGEFSQSERALFYLKTIPQLFGEEVVSILPFLAILWLCHTRLAIARKPAVIIAWLGAAVLFGAMHLPTYDWNAVQCFLVIGSARVMLLIGYIATKNILVSAGAHIINDWLIFTVIVLVLGQQTAAL